MDRLDRKKEHSDEVQRLDRIMRPERKDHSEILRDHDALRIPHVVDAILAEIAALLVLETLCSA